MENFSVQLLDKSYQVVPQENGTFRVMDGEEKIGVIYPEVNEEGTAWKTMDDLDPDFVDQIGELVSDHNM
jgi:hypothetical protein